MTEAKFWRYIDLINRLNQEGLTTREREHYQVYLIKMLLAKENFEEVVMSTYGRFPIAIEKGLGCRLWDTEGK